MEKFLCLGIFVVQLNACATHIEETKVDSQPTRLSYTLNTGEAIAFRKPLPRYQPIYIDWSISDGSIQRYKKFNAWDVDHDGSFEMIEMLDENMKSVSIAFDFNGDGQVDLVKATVSSIVGDLSENEVKKQYNQQFQSLKLAH
jgi:hypothetical protein